MNRLISKKQNMLRRKARVRRAITGRNGRPRLSISISNKHVFAQIIDDSKGVTIASANSIGSSNQSLGEKTESIGAQIAKKAKEAKVNKVVFDRNGKLYHGLVKKFAEAAKKEGLEF